MTPNAPPSSRLPLVGLPRLRPMPRQVRRSRMAAWAAMVAGLAGACGTDVSGPGQALFECAYGGGTALEVGESVQLRGAENEALCLTATAAPGDFLVYIPFFAAPPADDENRATLDLELVGGGLEPSPENTTAPARVAHRVPMLLRAAGVGGTADAGMGANVNGAAASPRPVRGHDFHDALRQREIRELGPRLRGGSGGVGSDPPERESPVAMSASRSSSAPAPSVPDVGDVLELNVAISCTAMALRGGRVMHVSEHAIVVADTSNPADLDPTDYAYFGVTFDTLVHPVETAHFGTPADIDGNGRAILFFTSAVNELNPRDADAFTIGFFWSGDLFPEESTERLESCPAANQAEMFYLLAPDPDGAIGYPFSLDDVRELAIPLIGHEFQHLVNASRRMFVNEAVTFEEPWLNEGLSHAAEELLFYEAAGLDPGQNLTEDAVRAAPNGVAAFNEYMVGNFGNFQRYLESPATESLMGIDLLETRGASWAFVRYAADRSARGDEAFFYDVVNSSVSGLDNLGEVLGQGEPLDWMRDWTVSVYADDFVPGIPGRFQQLSWDLRSIYEGSTVERYPLKTRTLSRDGELMLELEAGGAAFTVFSVPPGVRGLLEVTAAGKAPPSSLRGTLLRVAP